MTIAFLATGDELIHGDTLNTNGHFMAQALASEGIPLGLQLVCSDKESDIFESLKFLSKDHHIILITGGLGPTSDDRTRFALAKFLNSPLIEFPLAINHIEQGAKRNGRILNQGDRTQVLFPANANLFPNPYGTALGCSCYYQDRLFILLPGPPRECLPMFNDYALPLLQTQHHSDKLILKWRVFGLPESQIADKLDKALSQIDCQTGYRWENPYVEFKVRCKPNLVPAIQELIEPILKPYIIAPPEKKASDLLIECLNTIQTPIGIFDEATGGALQFALQQPANYEWLKFYFQSNQSLQFHVQGLEEYWTGKKPGGQTSLSIHYKKNGKEICDKHDLPYRNAMVIQLAMEWLSFRLLHLINQLHQ